MACRRLGIVSLRSIICGGGCRGRGSVSVALLNGDRALFDGTLRFAKVTLLFHVLQ
uniref:Uncharacterized protein n=1 Tax=Brassica oleracea var. oleracea TaxID=109376 RepID=A0A0D3E2C6_BRAOL